LAKLPRDLELAQKNRQNRVCGKSCEKNKQAYKESTDWQIGAQAPACRKVWPVSKGIGKRFAKHRDHQQDQGQQYEEHDERVAHDIARARAAAGGPSIGSIQKGCSKLASASPRS
jgi:hypothetical protein